MTTHILWDWNGTLLDDTRACVDTLNLMLARRGRESVTLEYFRDNFAFPSRRFYEKLGMDVPDSEWDALAREYYETYAAQPVALNAGTIEALEAAKARGWRQSVLSALRQDLLEANLKQYGILDYFDYVYGSDNLDGGSKLQRAMELLAFVKLDAPVLIGDSVHDFEVAKAMGIKSVLFSGGSHSRTRLEAVAPVGDTLVDCLSLVAGMRM